MQKKRKRKKENDLSQLYFYMNNNSYGNINNKIINSNNNKAYSDNSINYNKINKTFLIEPKNNFKIAKLENHENKNINKTFLNIFNNTKRKTERIMEEIHKYNKDKKRMHDIVRSIFREFQDYLIDKKKENNLEGNFWNQYLDKKIKSYSHHLMENFFSEDNSVCELYMEFLGDTIIKNEKKDDYPYKICRDNFHKIYSEKYHVNDLEFKK